MADQESSLQRCSAYAQILGLFVAAVGAYFAYLQLRQEQGSRRANETQGAKQGPAGNAARGACGGKAHDGQRAQPPEEVGDGARPLDAAVKARARTAACLKEAEARVREAERQAEEAMAAARAKEAAVRAEFARAAEARAGEAEARAREAEARTRAAEARTSAADARARDLKARAETESRQEAAREEQARERARSADAVVYYRCATQRYTQLEEAKAHDFVRLCRQLSLTFIAPPRTYQAGGKEWRPVSCGGPRDAAWRMVRARDEEHAEGLVRRLLEVKVDAQRERPESFAD